MAKRITETSTRWCCEFNDFMPVNGQKLNYKRVYDRVYCKHCGAEHEFYTFMDAAGSTDWNYRPVKEEI
jgi:hypothetical protein